MTQRRPVRVDPQFFAELDAQLRETRGDDGEPSSTDFLLIDVEHAVGAGVDAEAVAYVETTDRNGASRWGVGIHASILTASLQAVVSALNGRERDSVSQRG